MTAKWAAQASHSRSVIRGAAAFSAAIAGILRVEQPEHVLLEAVALGRRQLADVAAVVRGQLLDVGRTAVRVADRVDVDDDVAQPDVAVEARGELDLLGVDPGARVADRLDVELPELAEAAGLGPVVAEHRAGQRDLHRLRQRLHPVLDVGPDDAGGRLRAERPGLALVAPRGEPEQLLLDGVRRLAEAPLEHRHLLEHRRLDLAIAVAPGEVRRDRLEPPQGGSLGRQEVAGAARGAEGRHGRESSGRTCAGGLPRAHSALYDPPDGQRPPLGA